ncbi:MAG: hypothetical protein ACTSXT_08095 [Candidatus Helarchaeota archaeon]
MKSKIIVIDCGVLTHKAIFSYGSVQKKIMEGKIPEKTFLPPVSYTFFQMLIGSLKRIGVDKEDIIILAQDKTNSWRKFFYSEYKAQRKDFRDSHEHIDWDKHYTNIDKLLNQIDEATNWHIVWLPNCWNGADLFLSKEGQKLLNEADVQKNFDRMYGIEADDIIAVASKYYFDREVIFISIDADLDQLSIRENTKFFTLTQKYRGGTGVYKIIDNGYKILAKKIEKGDISDNIIPGKTDKNTENDVSRRELIIDLINLPSFVEEPIKEVLENLPQKEINLDKLPFQNSLAKRFLQIYEKDKILTYEDCVKRLKRKEKKRRNKNGKRK